jgi:hypothetical protein
VASSIEHDGGGCRWAAAVLYDPEVWPYTPVAEQRNPVHGTQEAAAIARLAQPRSTEG